MSTWWIWSLVYFHSFEALNDAFEVQIFQGFIFTPYQRHWQHLGPCSSDIAFNFLTKFISKSTFSACTIFIQTVELTDQFDSNLSDGVCIKLFSKRSESEEQIYDRCLPLHVRISYKIELPVDICIQKNCFLSPAGTVCAAPPLVLIMNEVVSTFIVNTLTVIDLDTGSQVMD